MIRRHAEMLADAGVDVIIFDSTNDDSHPPEYRKIAATYEKMRAAGEMTPQIAFLASAKSITQVWNDLYLPGLYKDLWFQWKGKPLLLIGQQRGMPHIYQLPSGHSAVLFHPGELGMGLVTLVYRWKGPMALGGTHSATIWLA